MYVVILGAGRIGYQLARQLIDEGKNVALIESDKDKARDVLARLDCLVVNDNGTSLDTLRKAGIQKADAFVSVTDFDEINMIACGLVSSEFEKPVTIARVKNVDYSKTKLLTYPFLGIDYIINPEIEAARAILRAVENGARSDVMLFDNKTFQIRDLILSRESLFFDRTLQDIRREMDFEFLVAVIIRDDFYIIPTGETVFQENDKIYILSTEEGLEKIFTREKRKHREFDRILLVGGGTVGTYVADGLTAEKKDDNFFKRIRVALMPRLTRKKGHLHIIDMDYDRSKYLAERYPQALVTCEDVTDEGILEESKLSSHDLIITTTSSQELNVMTSVYAKSLGVGGAISLVTRQNYRHIAQKLNLDVTISRNSTMVNSILKIIRHGNIKNVHAISEGTLEVIEFSLDKDSSVIGKSLKDIRLPKDTLVLFLTRGEETIFARGDMVLNRNDHVVILTERDSIQHIEKMMAG
jgi:trk system potassium uptake protein TrkA